MTELAKHIEILLLNNDCVIIPGFGGFMTHHKPSVYIEEESIFLPPSRTLGFNPQLRINDSLLAQSYVEAFDISYPEALQRIDNEVRELKQTIEAEGSYEFSGIGYVRVNIDGNYEFEPYDSGILTPELYGLSSFEFKTLSSSNNLNPEEDINSEEEVSEEFDEISGLKIININLIRNIAAAAILLVFCIFVNQPVGDSSKAVQQKCAIDTSVLTSFMPQVKTSTPDSSVSLKMQDSLEKETVVKEDTPFKEEEAVETLSKTENCFVIVLASRVMKSNAEEYVANLKMQGVEDARILGSNNSIKVVCGNFHTENEANTAARKMRDSSEQFAEVWTLNISK